MTEPKHTIPHTSRPPSDRLKVILCRSAPRFLHLILLIVLHAESDSILFSPGADIELGKSVVQKIFLNDRIRWFVALKGT